LYGEKEKKTRTSKDDEKLAINSTFDELIKVRAINTPPKKASAVKKATIKKKKSD
jgi:hypothetical protein